MILQQTILVYPFYGKCKQTYKLNRIYNKYKKTTVDTILNFLSQNGLSGLRVKLLYYA